MFAGNPPAALVIQRKVDANDTGWLDWRYFATDCVTAFGVAPYLAPPDGSGNAMNTALCSIFPWYIMARDSLYHFLQNWAIIKRINSSWLNVNITVIKHPQLSSKIENPSLHHWTLKIKWLKKVEKNSWSFNLVILSIGVMVRCSSDRITEPSTTYSMIWDVLKDRLGVLDQSDSPLFDQMTRATAIRIILTGHLLSLPNTAVSTTYGADIYGITEIGVYGRYIQLYKRSVSNKIFLIIWIIIFFVIFIHMLKGLHLIFCGNLKNRSLSFFFQISFGPLFLRKSA